MAEPFIKPRLADKIAGLMERAFATEKLLGTTIPLILYRDSDEDGGEVEIPPQMVLVNMAAREPQRAARDATSYMGADGELAKEFPFDVRTGDRFRLPSTMPTSRGAAGVVTIVLPMENNVVRALFTLQA